MFFVFINQNLLSFVGHKIDMCLELKFWNDKEDIIW